MRVLAIAVVVAGCYEPPREAPCSLTCTMASGCPEGLECNGATCTLPGGSCGVDDGGVDAPDLCHGRESGKGLLRLCFDGPLTGDLTLTTQTIVTAAGLPDGCTVMREEPGMPEVCVIAAERITIPATETITARGTLPLVLVASSSLVIAGELDAAGRRGTGNAPGANTNDTPECPAGPAPTNAGGGAGGSFGGRGGSGGKGAGASTGGMPGSISAPTATVRGGCSGQAGEGSGANAGQGGGAVYLIAGSVRIAASAIVNVSGGGGGGAVSASGGGGGGSGGLVGIDTANLSYEDGILVANGGGGGCGVANGNGLPGAEPTATQPQARALGCSGATAGTGTGGAGTSAAGADGDPGTVTTESGDGGGGGVGEIVFFGPTAPEVGAPKISPPRRHVP